MDLLNRLLPRGSEEPVDVILRAAGARDVVDQIAPVVYEEYPGRIRVGDVWMQGFYVADLPQGMGAQIEKILRPGAADVWVSMFIVPLPPAETAAMLHRRRTELAGGEIFDARRGSLGSYRRQAQLMAVDEAIREIELGSRSIYHFSLYMMVIAADSELLDKVCRQVRDYMQAMRVAFYPATWIQPSLEYSVLPTGTDRVQVRRNMTASALGNLFPFTRRVYYDPKGFPYGVHAVNGTWVIMDPFASEMANASHLILGRPGTGKSAFLKRFVETAVILGHRVFVIDLEGEYEALVEDLQGVYISLHRKCPYSLNVLDPGLGDEDPFGAGLSALLGFLGIAVGRELTATERQSVVPYSYHALLDLAGVNKDDPESWERARHLTLVDLQRLMEQEGGLAADLARLLYPYTSENMYGGLFARPTNVEIGHRPVVCFSLRGVSEEMLAPFMWAAITVIWREIVRSGGVQPVHVIVDEGWYLMRHPDVGRAIGDMARRFRKHRAALHLATHFGRDFALSPHAPIVRDAAGVVLLFGQHPQGAKEVGSLFSLEEHEVNQLVGFGQGSMLMIWDGRVRVPVYVPLDPRRKWLMETGALQREMDARRRGIIPRVVE